MQDRVCLTLGNKHLTLLSQLSAFRLETESESAHLNKEEAGRAIF